jgi:hypothetical protein
MEVRERERECFIAECKVMCKLEEERDMKPYDRD